MSEDTLRLVVGGVLLVHGVAHVGALGALWWLQSGRPTGAGSWTAARSWLLPTLEPAAAARIAATFWLVALAGFVLTALAFWGLGLPEARWRPLAVVSAVVSGSGIVVFLGTWPLFNTAAAMAVNIAAVVAALIGWPPGSLL